VTNAIFLGLLKLPGFKLLKYNFILIYDFTIIETGGFNVFFVVKGQMMLKKIVKIKNFNNLTFWCGKCQTGSVVTV
jgi:hypothetical protein